MKKRKAIIIVFVLAVLTGIAAWMHLSSRETVAAGTLQLTVNAETHTVKISDLQFVPVSGVRVNGKGESIPVEGEGISVKALLETRKVDSYSKVRVISDDSYTAELTAEEVEADGKAYLMLDETYLRLMVFGDQNSKRSVSNVVQIIVE